MYDDGDIDECLYEFAHQKLTQERPPKPASPRRRRSCCSRKGKDASPEPGAEAEPEPEPEHAVPGSFI